MRCEVHRLDVHRENRPYGIEQCIHSLSGDMIYVPYVKPLFSFKAAATRVDALLILTNRFKILELPPVIRISISGQ
jgi:hypothetical protein